MTGVHEERSYCEYKHPDLHIYGIEVTIASPEGGETTKKLVEFVRGPGPGDIVLRHTDRQEMGIICLPFAGMMRLKDAMEDVMDDAWRDMNEEEREQARSDYL